MRTLKLYLSTILTVMVIFTVHGQTKWSLGISAAPSLTKLANSEADYRYRPAYGFGITSIYFPISQIFLKTGVTYKTKNSILKDIPDTRNIINPDGSINYDNVEHFDFTRNSHFISFPLMFNYIVPCKSDKKASLFFATGVELSYLFKERATAHFIEGEQTNTNKGKEIDGKFSTSLNVGAGLFYKVSSKLILLIEPEYGYDFYSTKVDSAKNGTTFFPAKSGTKFHSFALNIELHYKLK